MSVRSKFRILLHQVKQKSALQTPKVVGEDLVRSIKWLCECINSLVLLIRGKSIFLVPIINKKQKN